MVVEIAASHKVEHEVNPMVVFEDALQPHDEGVIRLAEDLLLPIGCMSLVILGQSAAQDGLHCKYLVHVSMLYQVDFAKSSLPDYFKQLKVLNFELDLAFALVQSLGLRPSLYDTESSHLSLRMSNRLRLFG